MNLIDLSVKNGTAVVVGMILVVLFGFLALERIPIQLNPTIDQPVVLIETTYPGAAPTEVESEVTMRQEERLAAVENLRRMKSESREGQSEITLEFDWGVNKDIASIDILKKLNLVQHLPEDVEEPQIWAATSEEGNSIMRITAQSKLPVNELRESLEDRVGPRLERVPGVSRIQWYGGSRREVQVLLDLPALESRHVSISEVMEAIGRENQNLRGGKIEEGNSRLLVRTVGQYTTVGAIERTVVKNGADGPIRIEDIAKVVDTFRDPERIGRTMGKPTVNMSVSKKSGTNTLEVASALNVEISKLNKELKTQDIELSVNYDVSDYIWDSIKHVRNDLIYGAILATAVLLLFLRSFSATFTIGLTIPICTIGTFVLLAAFGRSVNVISLAGLAFATGMVVDDGIVVVENIFRHRKEFGSDPFEAARNATQEVWAPVLASTLTTLAVFIPVLFIREEAGQLFRDIAYSISFAVGLSLIASITVVPMVMSRIARREAKKREDEKVARGPDAWLGRGIAGAFERIVELGLRSKALRFIIMGAIIGGFLLSLKLVPPAEYLPQSKSSFIFGSATMPSGYSLEAADHAIQRIEKYVLDNVKNMNRVFFVSTRERTFFGIFLDQKKVNNEGVDRIVGDVQSYAERVLPSDVRVNVNRGSDFNWRNSGGKRIEINVSGPDMDTLQSLTDDLEERLNSMPEVRGVFSSLNLANPELQVHPDRERLADLGLTSRDLALVVETLLEGTQASLYREGGKEYDLIVKARRGQILHPDQLREVTMKTPGGRDVRLEEIATIQKRLGPVTIQHLEQERVIALDINIDEKVPLETFINKTETEIIQPFRNSLPPGYSTELSGTADDLRRTMKALAASFALAVLITYLLLAALFESFLYPMIIMFSVPLAMTGAFLGVWLTGSEFNVITMLGLILLAGIVVKNAILLVEFTLKQLREGVEPHQAVIDGVKVRMRPIFMTSATTVLGMLPMVVMPGSGSELYRGLGAAVVGGMTLSTIFTLILIPLMMATVLEIGQWMTLRFARVPILGDMLRRAATAQAER